MDLGTIAVVWFSIVGFLMYLGNKGKLVDFYSIAFIAMIVIQTVMFFIY